MATEKAGETIGPKALTKAGGLVHNEKVQPKAEGKVGQWWCIDCGFLAQHNMDANNHESENPKRRLAWRNFETGNVEEA